MNQLKRIARRLAAFTAPYDVPADHAFSRQAIEERQNAFPVASAVDETATEAQSSPFFTSDSDFGRGAV